MSAPRRTRAARRPAGFPPGRGLDRDNAPRRKVEVYADGSDRCIIGELSRPQERPAKGRKGERTCPIAHSPTERDTQPPRGRRRRQGEWSRKNGNPRTKFARTSRQNHTETHSRRDDSPRSREPEVLSGTRRAGGDTFLPGASGADRPQRPEQSDAATVVNLVSAIYEHDDQRPRLDHTDRARSFLARRTTAS